jgi:Rieske Fe-S protein
MVAAIVAGCGNGQFGPNAPADAGPGGVPNDGPVSVNVSNFTGLSTVGRLVHVANLRAAKRLSATDSATAFTAYSLICTHQQCEAAVDGDGQHITCPCHGSRFDVNGNVVNGPAASPLPEIKGSVFNTSTHILTIP